MRKSANSNSKPRLGSVPEELNMQFVSLLRSSVRVLLYGCRCHLCFSLLLQRNTVLGCQAHSLLLIMDAPRPFKQSAWNSLGGARTPERLSISGNDVSGFMTEQRNHSNNNYLQITINDPDGINDTKIERIRRVAGRMQESIGFPSAGTLPANFQTHSQRQGKEHHSA